MDLITIIGILFGIAAILGGFLWEGGHLGGLLQLTAALIVFGGTFAAVMVSFSPAKLKTIPKAIRFAFQSQPRDSEELIHDLSDMASTARRSGVLALEQQGEAHGDVFLREGIQLVVDGTDQPLIRQIMELEIDARESRWEGYAKIFEAAGGYAPTMGIIGTVMGLIHVLGSLQEPADLAQSIALAFTATLYGVASANLIFLPIASKIKSRAEEEVRRLEMIMLGVISVQNGDHPLLVRKKLEAFAAAEPGRSKDKAAGIEEPL